MPRFAILRDLDPDMTREEVDTGALQTLFNMSALNAATEEVYTPAGQASVGEIGWVRSYWHEGTSWGMCCYAARDEDAVELYHRSCDVEYVEFNRVDELASPENTDPESGRTRAHDGEVVFALEAELPPGASVDEDLFEDVSRLLSVAGEARVEGKADSVRWVRAYWDEENHRALAVYVAPAAETLDALAASVTGEAVALRPITEVYPDEYTV